MLTIEQARDMRQGVTLTGDRNQCAECGELFNSVYPFEIHRTGTVGVKVGPDARRCMSLSEMRLFGMVKNPAGFWISRMMADEARESFRESPPISLGTAAKGSDIAVQPLASTNA